MNNKLRTSIKNELKWLLFLTHKSHKVIRLTDFENYICYKQLTVNILVYIFSEIDRIIENIYYT